MTSVLICCGSGGVGKTTTSAALAVHIARGGKRVVVLTIDPARRLADALALGEVGNSTVEVPLPGLPPGGALHAMMLDPKQTFDEVVGRFAPTDAARERILRNRMYQNVSGRLAGAHEYMAMEKLYELVESGDWDAVVLDTPPTRHALDFLRAPEKIANLMDEGVMSWLVLPASRGGWRMLERGSEVVASVLQRLVGERTVTDIAEFFAAFQLLWEGFRLRSLEVRAMLRAPATRFLLVTTPAPGATAEALEFLALLQAERFPFAGFLVNKCATAPRYAGPPRFAPGDDPLWGATVAALAALPERQRAVVAAQEETVRDLRGTVWRLPELDAPIHDMAGLVAFADLFPPLSQLTREAGSPP